MKKLLFTMLGFFLASLAFSQTVIISQYIETNSGNTPKGIEIWNPSGVAINFATTNLVIKLGRNGGALTTLVTINTGTLGAGGVLVIGTSDMDTAAELPDECPTNVIYLTQAFDFNGDDALSLELNGVVTDIFGNPGSDPGTAWTGGTPTVSTANNNIKLKAGITTGDTNGWTDPSERFETESSTNALTNFGVPPTGCSSTSPVVQFAAAATSGLEGNAGTTNFPVNVTLSSDPGQNIQVTVTRTGGTATSGTDFVAVGGPSNVLTFNTGQAFPQTRTYNLVVTGETTQESNETVILAVAITSGTGASLGSITSTTVTIQDDDTPLPAVCINEVDADQAVNPDAQEFVELKGPANTSLNGLVLVLFNGSNDLSYAAYDLDGFSTDANGLFVIGNATGADYDVADGFTASDGIQNGADAVALYLGDATSFPANTPVTSTNLISALVYDTDDADDTGLLTGLGETIQYNENQNALGTTQSIQRSNDNCNTDNFFVGTPTQDALNGIGPVTVGFVSDVAVVEGNAGTSIATVSVTMNIDPLQNTVVTITNAGTGTATSGTDFVAISGPSNVLTFTTGGVYPRTLTFNVTINGDVTQEPNETINLALAITTGTVATLGDNAATITIQNDDTPVASVCINELRISSDTDDDLSNNFVELRGNNNTSLNGLYLVVLSGEFNPGQVDFAFDLTGGTTDANGFFLLGEPTSGYTFGTGDLQFANTDFFGSPSTFLVVSNFTGTQGTDYDANNDGTLETTPWTTIIDGVSLIDTDATADVNYSATIVGPQSPGDATFPPAGIARVGDNCASDTYNQLAFDSRLLDTPGQSNANTCTASITSTSATCNTNTAGTDTYTATFVFDIGTETGTFNVSASAGVASPTTISADGTITVTGISEGTNVTLTINGNVNTNCQITSVVNSPNCIVVPTVCINEVDADQTGTDNQEFVELKGPNSTSLNGLVLVLFNGDATNNVSYAAYDLDGYTTSATGFFVIGNVTGANYGTAQGFPASDGVQNGTDGIGLYVGNATDFPVGTFPTTTNLISAIVYETGDAADSLLQVALGVTTQYDENVNSASATQSIQRNLDNCNTNVFFVATPTPGAANGGTTLCSGLSAGNLVITEIMQNPDTVSDARGEYFELYNATANPINLQGLIIKDNGTDNHLINSSVVVAAGDYAILGINDTTAVNGGIVLDYKYSSFFLANGDDEIVLVCGTTTVDSVAYDGGPNFPNPTGASMNLNPTQLAGNNNLGSNWCTSTTPFGTGDLGTPGAANNACGSITIPTVVLNEIGINPPGTDDNFEFIELKGTASASLAGLSIIVLEGDGAAPGAGVIDQIISLNSLSLGSNGLLLFRENSTTTPGAGFIPTPAAATTKDSLLAINLENGTSSFFLVSGFTGTLGQDLDTNDDGILNIRPWTVGVDSVALTDGGATDRMYAGAARNFPQFTGGLTADALFRTSNTNTWAAVEIGLSAVNPGPYNFSTVWLVNGADTLTVDTFLTPGNVNTIFKATSTCPVNQNFTGTVAAGTYKVSNAITTSGTTTIATATTVVFDAGVSVTLSPGFTAAAGSTFTAKIGGCVASLTPTIVEARTEELKASIQENLVIYPNPLSESTTIAYELVNPTEVSVMVMDLKGKQIANLVNAAKQDAGTYYVNFDASNLTSGLYVVIVRTGDKVMTEKISVAK